MVKIAILAGGRGSPIANALDAALRKFRVPIESTDPFEADVVIVSTLADLRTHVRCGQTVAFYAHGSGPAPPVAEIDAAGGLAKAFSIDGPDADILPLVRFIQSVAADRAAG